MSWNKGAKRSMIAFGLAVLGLVMLWALMTNLALAQGPINLDGLGDE